jgi:Protein of unknown function (DUF3048) N-terminal domain/Protein of unknown function (DUF3048) C-terminal domain
MGALKRSLTRPGARLIVGAAGGIVIVTALIVGLVLVPSGSGSSPVEVSASVAPSVSASATPAPPPPQVASPINGMMLDRAVFDSLQQKAPLAIMIENHPDARPQSGLNQADLVYEAIAEGGITRFMAVYWSTEAARIQYVRSARIYYIQWAAELSAVYCHWGQVEDPGPVDVWPVLARLNVRDLNGLILGEEVGYRDESRYAPHNVFTDTGLLWRSAQAHGFNGPPVLEPWKFKEDEPQRPANPAERAAPIANVTFGSPGSAFDVTWYYDPVSNSYLRSMGGAPHTDATTGEQLSARNIAVQLAPIRPSGIKAYNIIDTVGTGAAVVFQDGVAKVGTWRKDSEGGRTRFFDSAGGEMTFNRGRTWIEVVPTDSAVNY